MIRQKKTTIERSSGMKGKTNKMRSGRTNATRRDKTPRKEENDCLYIR